MFGPVFNLAGPLFIAATVAWPWYAQGVDRFHCVLYTIYLPPCMTIPSLLQMTPPEHRKLSRATKDEDSPDCSLITSGSNRLKLLLCCVMHFYAIFIPSDHFSSLKL